MGDSGGPLASGTVIGPYRLVRELGRGGMGVVHEAHDAALDRRVAVKVVAPELAGDEGLRRRFAREARALAALDSAHVVQVHAYGEVGGRPYLVTQLLPDGDLGALLQRSGPLPLEVALDLVAQVADGLADVHGAGVVHGDVKPSNVLLRRRGGGLTAYVADFGVARDLASSAGGRPGTVGTPSYLAPELQGGGATDVRTDVYALGCLLWATLTGRPPAAGEQPRLPGRSTRVARVNRVLRRALAPDPAGRYPSAAELRDDLRRAGRRAAPARILVAGVVLAATAAGWTVATGAGPDVDVDPAADRTLAAHNLTAALLDQDPTLSIAAARCTAQAWIDDVGLARLVAEGYFTDELDYVDLDIARASTATRLSLTSATVACSPRD